MFVTESVGVMFIILIGMVLGIYLNDKRRR